MSPLNLSRTLTRPRIASGRWLAACVTGVVAIALAVWRYRERQPGLLVPDGYQYLLMARGIGEHLRPITQLGPEGAQWLPNTDASWKPLFPALVATGDALGLTPLGAAQLIVAVCGALLVVASGAIVWLYGRSLWATSMTVVLVALSPSVRHWQAFVGPDALAPALALSGAALALAGQPVACGLLVGLAAGARPEWGIVAVVVIVAAGLGRAHLRAAQRALAAATASYAALLLALRPPLEITASRLTLGLVAASILALVLGALLAQRAGPRTRRALGVAAGIALAGAVAFASADDRLHGLVSLLRDDPWLALAALAVAAGILRPASRQISLLGALAIALLAVAYLVKNPGSERYLSQLVAPAAIICGIVVSDLPRLRPALAAGSIALAVIASLLAPAHLRGQDPLLPIAEALPHTASVLIVGQPEGLSFYRPDLSLVPYATEARGLIVSDPISRDYSPTVVDGSLVKTIPLDFAVRRRDGSVDSSGISITRGRLIAAQ